MAPVESKTGIFGGQKTVASDATSSAFSKLIVDIEQIQVSMARSRETDSEFRQFLATVKPKTDILDGPKTSSFGSSSALSLFGSASQPVQPTKLAHVESGSGLFGGPKTSSFGDPSA